VSRHIDIRLSDTVYQAVKHEAGRDGTTIRQFALEAVLFRVAFQRSERGDDIHDALREIFTYLWREERFGREASDQLRQAVIDYCPDLLAEVIRRLEEFDRLAANTARAVYQVPQGHYHPETA
jgi:hypothetical protein